MAAGAPVSDPFRPAVAIGTATGLYGECARCGFSGCQLMGVATDIRHASMVWDHFMRTEPD